ncbi:developmentally regulated G-protein 2 [Artemisia annua]|uniref:Developmentally regulated G-protein 2 n=1 Tax=Artemisia annua TaxID=35608 RepID=A0A2U1QJV9_ARTAN|nr:developmentally regulated G-protein 2 [Artemisia annua]
MQQKGTLIYVFSAHAHCVSWPPSEGVNQDSANSQATYPCQQTDFGDPVVLSADKGGCSAEDFCNQIHRSLVKEVKYMLVWGSSARHSPQHCGLSHVLQDQDVVQIINKKEKVGGNKNKGLSYG